MIVLALLRRNGTVDLLIVMAQENLDRIRAYDPVEVMWHELPMEYRMRRPATIGVTFCTAAEQQEIERLSVTDPEWKAKAFKMLTRGFQYQPDKGDHDFGLHDLGKPTEGPKQ